MATLNKVMIIGNVTKDVEMRYTPNGAAVVSLSVAVNRNYKDQSGEKKQETCFVDCVAWKQTAELVSKYVGKGDPVFIEGRLNSRSWQTPEGQNRNKIEITIENVQFLRSKQEQQAEPPQIVSNAGFMGEQPPVANQDDFVIPGEEEMF